jgi:hypothetical protein
MAATSADARSAGDAVVSQILFDFKAPLTQSGPMAATNAPDVSSATRAEAVRSEEALMVKLDDMLLQMTREVRI